MGKISVDADTLLKFQTMLACFVIMAVSGIVYGLLCYFDNKQRDKHGEKNIREAIAAGEIEGNNLRDLTDVQNKLCKHVPELWS